MYIAIFFIFFYIFMGIHHASRTIGHRLKQGLEVAGTLKGIYDIGSTVYKIGKVAAPLIGALLSKYIGTSNMYGSTISHHQG